MKKILWLTVLVAAVGVVLSPAAMAQDEDATKKIKVGDEAPDFELPENPEAGEDAPKKLSDLKGKKNVVLAFYPKAKTPGCTTQLCGYRDDFSVFESHDTEVVAISIDEQDFSNEFKQEHEMPFFVLGDSDASVVKDYGIPTKEYAGMPIAQRSIVVVDKEGIVRYIDMKYNIAKDNEPLYDAVAKLEGGAEEEEGS